MHLPRLALALGTLLALAPAARAQRTTLVVRRADSLAIVGDSAGALATLDSALTGDRKNAAAMHRRGVIAWGLARSGRRRKIMKGDDIKLIRMADSSLRMAAWLAPDSGRFSIDLGRFYLNSDLATLRFQAQGLFERALKAGERMGDSLVVADAADELGMSYWRRFEAVADRHRLTGVESPDLDKYARDPKAARTFIEQFVSTFTDFPGELDYTKASDLFRRAAAANPDHPRATRHIFMTLAVGKRWEELRAAATVRLAAKPWDGWAWLARGLASHRAGDYPDAAAAYDSALVFLTDTDRDRFTRLSRLLRTGDSTRLAALAPDVRQRTEAMYWLLSDPLWLTSTNEHRLEFLSRVTYAELRWTSDDLDRHGADTDRGDIWVRYGPPPLVIGLPPEDQTTSRIIWMYDDGLMFVFRAPPTWGTATFDGDYAELARQMRDQAPVRWDNLPVDRDMDSIAVQIARFRAPRDSADVFLVADLPVDSLVKGIDMVSGVLQTDLHIFDGAAQPVIRDSSRAIVHFATPDVVSTRVWRPRVGRGMLFYRVEALQPDAMHGARAAGSIPVTADSGFAASGFGVSDVLLAERVAPRAGEASRWSDFTIVPNVGVFRRGQSVDLLWETYELGQKDGSARYRVSLSLDRVRGTGAGAWVARVIGGAAGAVGVAAQGKERVTLTFDRQAPWHPATADYVSLDLGAAPPGRYRLTLEITDLVSMKRTSRQSRLTITP